MNSSSRRRREPCVVVYWGEEEEKNESVEVNFMEGVECEVGCLEHKSQEERTLSVVCCVVVCGVCVDQ